MSNLCPIPVNDVKWTRLTGSQTLQSDPCYVFFLVLTAESGGAADIELYNGDNSDDPQVCTLKTHADTTRNLRWQIPLFLNRGAYIKVGSNVTDVVIQSGVFCEERDGE